MQTGTVDLRMKINDFRLAKDKKTPPMKTGNWIQNKESAKLKLRLNTETEY